MIKPLLQDDDFLDDVRAARADADNLHLWWLGQSGFLAQWEGRHLLLDPYLSDSLTHKYALTDKPHVRLIERVVAPERLNYINVVTSSHNHTDHLDQETIVPLLQVNPGLELVIPEANRAFVAERLRVAPGFPRGLDAGQSLVACGFKIHGVPAAHNTVEKDELGRHKYLGYIVQAGPWTIYHSGDTKRYEGMEARLQKWPVDVALLPINGHLPERRVAETWTAARPPRSPKKSAPGWSSPATTTCSSSTPPRPKNLSPLPGGSASRTVSCAPANTGAAGS